MSRTFPTRAIRCPARLRFGRVPCWLRSRASRQPCSRLPCGSSGPRSADRAVPWAEESQGFKRSRRERSPAILCQLPWSADVLVPTPAPPRSGRADASWPAPPGLGAPSRGCTRSRCHVSSSDARVDVLTHRLWQSKAHGLTTHAGIFGAVTREGWHTGVRQPVLHRYPDRPSGHGDTIRRRRVGAARVRALRKRGTNILPRIYAPNKFELSSNFQLLTAMDDEPVLVSSNQSAANGERLSAAAKSARSASAVRRQISALRSRA
jgi:hypothetical protein